MIFFLNSQLHIFIENNLRIWISFSFVFMFLIRKGLHLDSADKQWKQLKTLR